MGNNGSSSRNEQAAAMRTNGLLISETSRGWSQSFPRELARHRSQPTTTARKVLPEPPNQRLRATNNGSIIHNGGTISGRRAPTFASSRDLAKRDGQFRGRSTSASNVATESRQARIERCRYQAVDTSRRQSEATGSCSELKRFGSEPDLRCSPVHGVAYLQNRGSLGSPIGGEEDRSGNRRRVEKDIEDRVESRYRAKKKYKAPAPPTTLLGAGNDSTISADVRCSLDTDARCRLERNVQPPPRRSRLFKTRAETKKARVGWQMTGLERTRHRHDLETIPFDEENTRTCDQQLDTDRPRGPQDRHPRSDLLDGKNTLRRSVSSPEFQAELIQVAKRVRDKLTCSRTPPIVDQTEPSITDTRSLDRRYDTPDGGIGDGSNGRERLEPTSLEAKNIFQDSRSRCRRTGDESEDTPFRRDPEADDKMTQPCIDRDRAGRPLRERIDRRSTDRTVFHRRSNEPEKKVDPSGAADEEIGWNASEGSSPRRTKEPTDVQAWLPEKIERKLEDKENSDPGWWNDGSAGNRRARSVEKELDPKTLEERRREHEQPFVATSQTAPKTFYFGMNELRPPPPPPPPPPLIVECRYGIDQPRGEMRSEFRDGEDGRSSVGTAEDTDDNSSRNVADDISLRLRPTLPKKQLEIPRFSPSAAWRLLSALETPGPSTSTASEEMPVMFEERIERLSRPPPPPPPPPLLALGPRSSHDKSGDSGISGDAGAVNEDSLDVSTINRMKTTATRPTWTPQQDLGEESSSDAGVDSPSPLSTPFKYHPGARVFSLSLPREDPRMYLTSHETKAREGTAFNSLKKLKRSMSGAFGIGAFDFHRKQGAQEVLDDNWFLSTSAPTSLQHGQQVETTRFSSAWKSIVVLRNALGDEEIEEYADDEETNDFPVVMKPPSFSYLAPGGHVMYLPESNEAKRRVQSLNDRKISCSEYEDHHEKSCTKETFKSIENGHRRTHDREVTSKRRSKSSNENFVIDDTKDKRESLVHSRDSVKGNSGVSSSTSKETKSQGKNGQKSKRFTFQSTVRQIERRRLAEKLSKEAEAKERQRRGELEAMRKVEEEFQRKRAKEKANIRQQLRLFKEMEENFNNLASTEWDGSRVCRAEPDGAPSSTASSPTWMPAGKVPTPGKSFEPRNEHRRKRDSGSGSGSDSKQRRGEVLTGYRPKYYDWAPDSSSHLESKQTTVHPKIVCDIPKSSPVFIEVNAHPGKPATTSNSTPRSDNYRKDFAHGAMIAKSSFASSDSELSQPNTRPHSRETGVKMKSHRSRSASLERSEDGATSEEDSPMEPVKRARNPTHEFLLGGVQPFTRKKSYRPISFDLRPSPPIPS
ncbi:hypothetical protein WN55_10331 [Dufourea novaeangliae]|uniref:Uncharacterized protein n=1 Tax=Dufourea novaeangliae TaxID=178035 RepID=A0A154P3H5_DUFNO|nr:hypothetical protein WN55_10331 [Dufourea novaeangliae]